MKNIFFFDSLITPKLLVVLYWLSLISILISAVFTMFAGQMIAGILALILGSLGVRVGFELIMIAFKNNEYLKRIADHLTETH
jgi:NADH:ubiquinone oxidoreductase subunit K